MRRFFQPKPIVTDEEFQRSVRWLQREAVLTALAGAVMGPGSGLLIAYALGIGASNVHIGFLTSVPFIFALFQIPTVLIVEKYKVRKLIAFVSWFASRILWFPVALIPLWFTIPSTQAVYVLITLVGASYLLIAVTNTAWSSWMRDLIPSRTMGAYFGNRFAVATLAVAAAGLLSSFFIDRWRFFAPGQPPINAYILVVGVAAVFSILDILSILPVPEPAMVRPASSNRALAGTMLEPYRQPQYRALAAFLFFWGLSANLATPFFAVYVLKGLNFSLTTLMLLTVLNHLVMVVFMRAWGPVADRFGSKPVLSIAVPLYMAVILGWVFTGMPDRYFFTIPLLVILSVLGGIATAGVTLSATTIMMKLAPSEKSTSYLTAFSVPANLGAGLAPLFGGFLADFFSPRQLAFTLSWQSPSGSINVPAFSISGFDFLFIIAFILGLLAVNSLAYVVERGEVKREVVLEQVTDQALEAVRSFTMTPGVRFLMYYPFLLLKFVPGLSTLISRSEKQLVDIVRESVASAVRGVDLASGVVRGITQAIGGNLPQGTMANEEVKRVAIQSVRGAVLAAADQGLDILKVTRSAVASTCVAILKTSSKLDDLFWATGYGAILGAQESNADLEVVAKSAIAGARDGALLAGADEDAAAASTAMGVLDALKQLLPAKLEEVQKALNLTTHNRLT